MRWRLLLDGAADGPWNMGVDDALLVSAAGGGPASVRLYGWSGPWLSLGYAQTLAPARRRACEAAGVGLVRRATGGRAVLHGADLTYCLTAPEGVLPLDLDASYARVAQALLGGLRELGVAARCVARSQVSGRRSFDCFASPGVYEIVAEAGKLCGSAQRRVRGAVLQHGSLRLAADPREARAAAGIRALGTDLADLGCRASRDEVTEALVRGFTREFGLLEPGGLSQEERRRAMARGSGIPQGRSRRSQGPPEVADTP